VSSLPKIGVVGTGRMGANIAKRLHDVGYPIAALYDVSPDSAKATAAETGGDSLLRGAEGKIFIICATVSPKVHVDVERVAEERGAHSLEACMSSSIPQARNGTLYLMVGGRREIFERVKPMLEKMSAPLKYIGEAHAAKDSGIALALAREAGLSLPLAQATYEQYEKMKELGLGELDKSGVSELTFKSRRGRRASAHA
jgi:3-hydroxyisobutyrate dehydrogenase-like beta-hydroxyacid dehydrogenase